MSAKRAKMCKNKTTFPTIAAAKKIANKFDQRVYECPICFCYHTTSLENWRDEFVRVELAKHETASEVNKMAQEKNKVIQEKNEKIRLLERHISKQKKAIKFFDVFIKAEKFDKLIFMERQGDFELRSASDELLEIEQVLKPYFYNEEH